MARKHHTSSKEGWESQDVHRLQDLNKASPKDDFPLPHIDTLVDNIARHKIFSFMDSFSGYNHIKMVIEDREKTSFITPWGTFCYRVMPFGLKNARATYQRAMTTLFHNMINKEMEVYVDDMIVKSRMIDRNFEDLEKLFNRLEKFKLRLNSQKCVFGATGGKLLGFIVSEDGIQVDETKTKVIKGQALADYLVAHSLPDYQPLKTFFFDENILLIEEEEEKKAGEWTLFFDGAANSKGSGVGVILYSPEDVPAPISRRLAFQCTNNMTEYEACIAGLREAIILNVKKLRVFGDSQLIINQINDDWRTKDEKLILYHIYLENLIEEFEEITFSHIPRIKNQFADALATLASMLEIPKGVAKWELTVELQEEPAFYLQIDEAEPPSNDRPWYTDIKKYLEHQKYPEGAKPVDRRTIQRLAAQFVITGGILYKRSFNQVLLRCVDETEAT
ncbi:uncharacterized protein LOC131232405 [Magnolia sinica]|uniref:uncharacterized protein LOC131232405 n=1 Tax=Magnolia sinica TaxID=86752 RepID=UPI0026598FCD|nr:uncharacterized protein LOC131232405 [Magnolia sinica]